MGKILPIFFCYDPGELPNSGLVTALFEWLPHFKIAFDAAVHTQRTPLAKGLGIYIKLWWIHVCTSNIHVWISVIHKWIFDDWNP